MFMGAFSGSTWIEEGEKRILEKKDSDIQCFKFHYLNKNRDLASLEFIYTGAICSKTEKKDRKNACLQACRG